MDLSLARGMQEPPVAEKTKNITVRERAVFFLLKTKKPVMQSYGKFQTV